MHWIATPPDGEHDQCRDWSRHPFPFDLQLEDLRRVTATLRHSYWTVVTFGRWVKDRRDQWPLDARATVTAFRARRDEVRRVPLEMTRRTRL